MKHMRCYEEIITSEGLEWFHTGILYSLQNTTLHQTTKLNNRRKKEKTAREKRQRVWEMLGAWPQKCPAVWGTVRLMLLRWGTTKGFVATADNIIHDLEKTSWEYTVQAHIFLTMFSVWEKSKDRENNWCFALQSVPLEYVPGVSQAHNPVWWEMAKPGLDRQNSHWDT